MSTPETPDQAVRGALSHLIERLALPGRLSEKALRAVTSAGADAGRDALEEAIDAVSNAILETRVPLKALAWETARTSARLRDVHRQLAAALESITEAVHLSAESEESFAEALCAEVESMRLLAEEVLVPDTPVDRAVGVGLRGILAHVQTRGEKSRAERERLAKALSIFAESLSAMHGDVEDNLERADRAERSAVVDDLTGCPNRLAYLERVEVERERRQSERRPLCLLCIGIDGLSEVNETFGHKAGDEAIRQVSELASKALQGADDFLARHSAGEFIALLPGAGLPDGIAVGERIRKAVAAFPFAAKGEKITISVSIGLTELRLGESSDESLHRAYRALRLARSRGGKAVATDRNLKEG